MTHNDRKTNVKEQIWTSIFLVLPVVLFSTSSDNFTNSSSNKNIFAGVSGGLGGLSGWSLYFFVKSKTTTFKIVSLTALLGLGISGILFIGYWTKPKLITCEICGYMTLKSTSTECEYCGNTTWEANKRMTEFATKEDWIKSEQLFWFGIDSLTAKIDFFNPAIDEGFVKDKNWKPLVSEQEIRNELNIGK